RDSKISSVDLQRLTEAGDRFLQPRASDFSRFEKANSAVSSSVPITFRQAYRTLDNSLYMERRVVPLPIPLVLTRNLNRLALRPFRTLDLEPRPPRPVPS